MRCGVFCVQTLVWKQLNYGGMKEKEKHLVVSEVNILRELRHPFIVRYYDRIIDKASTTIYVRRCFYCLFVGLCFCAVFVSVFF